MRSTVLQQPGGGLNITGYPLSHLGSFFDERDLYNEARFDSPNVCLREDYCVGIAENVTFDLYVSPVKSRYPLSEWINGIPYETFWSRTANLTEAAVNLTAPVFPLTDCAPYNVRTEGDYAINHLPFQCQGLTDDNVDDVTLEAFSECDMALADPLPPFPAMSTSDRSRLCRSTVCPSCPAEGQTTTDALQFVAVASIECSAYGIQDQAKPFVEVLFTVHNHDTGESHELYSLAHVGRTGAIVTVGNSPLRMKIELSPSRRDGNFRDSPARTLGDSIVVCGRPPRTHKRLRNPFSHGSVNNNNNLTAVPTRRYLASLTSGAIPQEELDQPAWYYLPAEDYGLYGRQCGQVGATSQSIMQESVSNLVDYCYTSDLNTTCVPSTSPCRELARLNAYSQNGAVRDALRSIPGSDPSLIASERPSSMPPREIWNDLFPSTYLASVADANTRNFQGIRPSLIVEHSPRTTADSGYEINVRLDISDSLLPDPVNNNANKIYNQKLSPTATTCSLHSRSLGGWGALSLTYCTTTDLPVVFGGPRLYEALVVCDESVGQLASGYTNTEILNRTAAIIRFEGNVGGPANTCTSVPSPVLFAPADDQDVETTDPRINPNDAHYAGSCKVTLFDGQFTHVQIGPVVEVDCVRHDSATLNVEDTSNYIILDQSPNCNFWNLRNEGCENSGEFNILALLIIVGVVVILLTILIVVIVICAKMQKTSKVKSSAQVASAASR